VTNHDTYATLAACYALGALDGDDLVAFEAHLAEGCQECVAALREAEVALAALASEAPAAIPPASVKQALMARAAAERGRRTTAVRVRPSRPRWFPWVAGAVAAGLAAFFTGMFVAARYEAEIGRMARETTALRERLREQETTLKAQLAAETTLRAQMAAANHVVDLIRTPGTHVVGLRGAGPTPTALGRMVWNDAHGGHLLVTSLPSLPADKTYELWTITAGKPSPAGLLTVDAGGVGGLKVDPLPTGGAPDIFAITVEPAGGVPAPTGPIVLASSK
jgi:anti-sigma-K factor RskA